MKILAAAVRHNAGGCEARISFLVKDEGKFFTISFRNGKEILLTRFHEENSYLMEPPPMTFSEGILGVEFYQSVTGPSLSDKEAVREARLAGNKIPITDEFYHKYADYISLICEYISQWKNPVRDFQFCSENKNTRCTDVKALLAVHMGRNTEVLVKVAEEYRDCSYYFVLTLQDEAMVELRRVRRVYNDSDAANVASLYGKAIMPPELTQYQIGSVRAHMLETSWHRPEPEVLVEGTEMDFAETDTISEYNLSVCFGDNRADTQTTRYPQLQEELDLPKYLDDNGNRLDDTPDEEEECKQKIFGFELAYQMLVRKYPENKDLLAQRRLDLWKEQARNLPDPVEWKKSQMEDN